MGQRGDIHRLLFDRQDSEASYLFFDFERQTGDRVQIRLHVRGALNRRFVFIIILLHLAWLRRRTAFHTDRTLLLQVLNFDQLAVRHGRLVFGVWAVGLGGLVCALLVDDQVLVLDLELVELQGRNWEVWLLLHDDLIVLGSKS